MSVISMKQLLEAGVHFGHQTRRWNPKMKKFIFTERNGIYIIDLQKTVKKIEEAYFFVRDVAMEGKPILFVGTKKQAQESIETEAKRCGQYYVSNRWLGGMLTNFKTIKSRINALRDIERMEETGEINLLPKKEVEPVLDYMLSEDFGPYKLGIEGRQIYIAYRIHLSDITDESEEEIRKNIVDLAFRADAMDNMLVERFGCEFSEYSKADAQ